MIDTIKEYRSVMLRIGIVMILHTVLFRSLYEVFYIVYAIAMEIAPSEAMEFVFDIFSDGIYLFSFLFPAYFFYLTGKKKSTRTPFFELKPQRGFSLMLFVGIAAILAASYINYYIMDLVNYYEVNEDLFYSVEYENITWLILSFISTAIVPAFCEEVLFRGVILTNLLPFGKNTAVLASAVLFALMHNNSGQLFYTFVGGIVLGLIYVRMRSIWGVVLIHMFNNLFSILSTLLYERLEESGDLVVIALDAAFLVLGAVCAVILLVREKKRKKDFSDSGFGQVLEPDEGYSELPMSGRSAAKYFFSPTIIIFICLCCVRMINLIIGFY